MKNFYDSNSTLLRAQAATVASESIYSSVQKKMTLLVLSMLLLSFNSFGQATYYSRVTTGNWDDGTSWSLTNNNNESNNSPANATPTAVDNVVINGGHKINVITANATCNK